jgi:hypothetical protein
VSLRGVEDAIPEPHRTAFRDAHVGATARNALLLSEAAEVQGAFTAAGIESVILKGPGLLVAHYPDIGARHVSDVDILVRWADSDRADAVVKALGGKPKAVPLFIPIEGGEGGHPHLTPLVTSRGVMIEIHTRLPGSANRDAEVGELIGRARDVSWQMRALRIPSGPDLAAMLCLHVFDHHGGLDEYLLRHLADLAVLMGSGGIRWSDVESRVAGTNREAVDASRRLLEEGATGFAAWRHVIAVRARSWAHLAARPEPGVLMTAVFPPRSFMASRYGVAPESRLLPLLYLWRPVRGVWRFVTGR